MSPPGTRQTLALLPQSGSKRTFTRSRLGAQIDPKLPFTLNPDHQEVAYSWIAASRLRGVRMRQEDEPAWIVFGLTRNFYEPAQLEGTI